ncbi:MAG: PIN domain-containing protein [Propionibacteriaceae bacterium]|jgi:predicted nucleic acid-binding protein|nr:PIN domain-containing protein [Propionibacteriaceae bacterium]
MSAPETIGQIDERHFIVDTSAFVRAARSLEANASLAALADRGCLCVTTTIALEIGFTAPSGPTWRQVSEQLSHYLVLHPTRKTHSLATELQGALWNSGRVRSIGTADLITAAIALEHDAEVIHYDQDFEYVAAVEPAFKHEWILPRGSVA